jgi:hypothetical protein
MDKTTLIVSGVLSVLMVLMIAPSVFRMNRGKILQNIAFWIAIFLALGLAYKVVGPGREAINLPAEEKASPTTAPAEDPLAPRT